MSQSVQTQEMADMPKPDVDRLWQFIKERICQETGNIDMRSPQEFSRIEVELSLLSEDEHNLLLAKVCAHCLTLPLVSEDEVQRELTLLLSLERSNPGLQRDH